MQQLGRKIGVKIVDERENHIELPDFDQRCGRLPPQLRPAGQSHVRGQVSIPNAFDEIGVGQYGRILKHSSGRFRLISRQG